jgi:ATP-dependent DNA helicase PIF1
MFPDGASALSLCRFVFGNVALRLQDLGLTPAYARWVAEGAILAPTNEVARELSSTVSSRLLGGNAVTLRSADGLQDPYSDPDNNYGDDILNLHQPNGFPPHKLELRTGDVVTIVRNLDCVLKNGVRAIVMDVFPNMLRIMVASGKEETIGTVHLLPRIKLIDDRLETGLPVAMFRIQFPVTLAWAMTINKAQGQTMKRVGLYLRTQCFSHGQLYVALSRSPSIHGVRVITCKKIRDVQVVRNVVWPELLPGIPRAPVLNLNSFPPAWNQPPQ